MRKRKTEGRLSWVHFEGKRKSQRLSMSVVMLETKEEREVMGVCI